MAETTPTETNVPARRRRWPRRLALVFIIFVLLIVASPLALALPFVRNMVASKAGEAIGREVKLDKAFAFWGKGVDLEGLTVSSPPGFSEPLAHVKHIHVDIDLLGLLRGNIDASILVDTPRVTILKRADGTSNLDGLVPEEDAETPGSAPEEAPAAEGKAEKGASPRIHIEVRDGVLRAQPTAGAEMEEISDLAATVDLSPDGAMAVDFSANARRAAIGGGDVPVAIGASLSSAQEGPVKIEIPELDLSRLAMLAEELAGIEDVKGTLSVSADGEARGGTGGIGRLEAKAADLAFRTKDGQHLTIGSVLATADIQEADGANIADVRVRIERIGFVDESAEEPTRFEEPLVELVLKGRHDAAKEELVVESAVLSAGQALSVTASKPWLVSLGDVPGARGQLDVQADLQRLARLEAIVPALSAIQGGRVAARIVAEASEGIDVKAGIRAMGLKLAPGVLSPDGYVEREIILQAHASRAPGEDAPMNVIVHRIQTSFLTFGPMRDAEPLTISISEKGIGAKGKSGLQVNLAALGQALGGVMGLKSGDRLGGTLSVGIEADAAGSEGQATATLQGRQILLPASWAEGVPPTDLQGEAGVVLGADEMRVALKTLKGFGLDVAADAVLGRGGEGEGDGLRHANVRISGDLARARPLLAPFLGMDANAKLAGMLEGQTQVVEGEGARTLKGAFSVKGLRWQDAQGRTVLDEPHLELRHDLAMGTEEDAYTVRELTLKARALTLELKGSVTTSDAGTGVDATVAVRGDAPLLASALRGMLGEDYRDLKGSGAITGTVKVQGNTAKGGETLLVNGKIAPGSWTVGGLTVNDATLTLTRAAVRDPLAIVFAARVNGGSTKVDTRITPREDAKPFSTHVDVKQVDTSPLLADRGFGKYLGYVLPTLIPTDSEVPVLSGKLDADIKMQAADLSGEKLAPTLKGQGSIRMTQGSLSQSTLFQAIGGGKGLGQVGQILTRTVPEVGSALASLSRSINFSRVESVFSVANEVVNVQKGLLESPQTRIDFKGTVRFDQRVDLAVNVALTAGKAAERLGKVLPSKTIPLRVRGTLDKPAVQPGLDAKDLTTGALEGLIPIPGRGGNKNPLEGLKDLLPR